MVGFQLMISIHNVYLAFTELRKLTSSAMRGTQFSHKASLVKIITITLMKKSTFMDLKGLRRHVLSMNKLDSILIKSP